MTKSEKRSLIFREKNYRYYLNKNVEITKVKTKTNVSNLIDHWKQYGIEGLKAFFEIYPPLLGSWNYKIKTLLDKGYINSVEEEISLIAFNINLNTKTKNNAKE